MGRAITSIDCNSTIRRVAQQRALCSMDHVTYALDLAHHEGINDWVDPVTVRDLTQCVDQQWDTQDNNLRMSLSNGLCDQR